MENFNEIHKFIIGDWGRHYPITIIKVGSFFIQVVYYGTAVQAKVYNIIIIWLHKQTHHVTLQA